MKVYADVKTMIGLETVVVTTLEIAYGSGILFGGVGLVFVVMCVEGSAIACGIDPCGREVDAVVQLLAGSNVYIVAAVIFSMKRASVVDDVSFAVKLAHGFRPSVGYPSSKLTHRALCHELESV